VVAKRFSVVCSCRLGFRSLYWFVLLFCLFRFIFGPTCGDVPADEFPGYFFCGSCIAGVCLELQRGWCWHASTHVAVNARCLDVTS
jgi:hypothetical protein